MSATGDILRFIAEHRFDKRPDLDGAPRTDITIWARGRFEVHTHANADGSDPPNPPWEYGNESRSQSDPLHPTGDETASVHRETFDERSELGPAFARVRDEYPSGFAVIHSVPANDPRSTHPIGDDPTSGGQPDEYVDVIDPENGQRYYGMMIVTDSFEPSEEPPEHWVGRFVQHLEWDYEYRGVVTGFDHGDVVVVRLVNVAAPADDVRNYFMAGSPWIANVSEVEVISVGQAMAGGVTIVHGPRCAANEYDPGSKEI